MTEITTEAPNFTPEFWQKVPRRQVRKRIAKINHVEFNGEDWTELILEGGGAFRRKKSEIGALLLPRTEIEVELIVSQDGELITGVFLPNERTWAFRMTNEELATYARSVANELTRRRQEARHQMIAHVAQAMSMSLERQGLDEMFAPEKFIEVCQGLAVDAVMALETGAQQ